MSSDQDRRRAWQNCNRRCEMRRPLNWPCRKGCRRGGYWAERRRFLSWCSWWHDLLILPRGLPSTTFVLDVRCPNLTTVRRRHLRLLLPKAAILLRSILRRDRRLLPLLIGIYLRRRGHCGREKKNLLASIVCYLYGVVLDQGHQCFSTSGTSVWD